MNTAQQNGQARAPEPESLREPPKGTENSNIERVLKADPQPPLKTLNLPGKAQKTSSEGSPRIEGHDDEAAEPKSFERIRSGAGLHRTKGEYETVGEDSINRMHKFSLYETSTRFYLVGADLLDKRFRVLKIDRTSPPGQLSLFEDDIIYDKKEMNQLLNAIDDGNKSTGGLKLKCSTWGILGFIRFTEAYYMVLITKRRHVALLGGHYIYQVDGTEMIPLTTGSTTKFQRDRNAEEARYLTIFGTLDLTRSFYFSYSYNITRTLQHNLLRLKRIVIGDQAPRRDDLNDMFVWNHYLLEPAVEVLKSPYDWCHAIIHGFIDQKCLDVFGRCIYITILARRSRFFAGARFLKRGSNDLGYVANDVETEQIVSDMTKSSFHAPGPRLYASPSYTSYVHHRGSIPLYWTQDNSGVSPKPDIDLNLVDPFYTAGALHFDNLFLRYGSPIYALNLVKARERTPRESKLLIEYKNAIDYLNQSLPVDKKIVYKAFDMSRASKTRGQDVIGTLEAIAEEVINKTSFFHNGDSQDAPLQLQRGVARTNCIDCLDRTNAAQFVIGKRVLGLQLQALGVISGDTVDFDTDAVDMFTHMFHDHGDTIAIQYGGSHLVNTMETYRKIKHWQSHSRDMVESFKRYYHNSFLDSQRQEAYNLFLGNYIYTQGQPMLWDLTTDYYLHHLDPRAWGNKARRNYVQWFTPAHLEPIKSPEAQHLPAELTKKGVPYFDDFWLEYYRPVSVSSLLKIYAFNIDSTTRYLQERSSVPGRYDPSPFCPRKLSTDLDSPDKKTPRKGVTIVAPDEDGFTHSSEPQTLSRPPSIVIDELPNRHSILRTPQFEIGALPAYEDGNVNSSPKLSEKNLIAQWTLNQIYHNSLNPSVTGTEAAEYERYVSHPLNLPLVVSTELPEEFAANVDLVEYVKSASGGDYWNFADSSTSTPRTFDISDEDLAEYRDFVVIAENPLTVNEEDSEKKRYKAYRKWLQGKSLFKQSKIDPEFRTEP